MKKNHREGLFPQLRVGNVRIQVLSPMLVRLEQRGKMGFEDRETFTVACRDWPGTEAAYRRERSQWVLDTANFHVVIPVRGRSLAGVRVEGPDGRVLYEFSGEVPSCTAFPDPGDSPAAWVMADAPRLVPPPWGATPPLKEAAASPSSGWDCGQNAPDVYVFIEGQAGYARMRAEFLKLTGAIPMPPLWAFGFWDSRYHAYTEKSALATIRTYRRKGIPLDVFVVDTDWRKGASHGYQVNTKLFPDMRRFIRRAHAQGVRVMFNDHPEPVSDNGLSPKELRYRWRGLVSMLKMGADAWWFDRNWHIGLIEPMPGLRKEVWGMCLYHNITRRFAPQRRPLIMSNVDGIDGGLPSGPTHAASHKYPIWWTGDTSATWASLRRAVENTVNGSIERLMPYINDDLGGHCGMPTEGLYVRYLQFGALCPIMRIHCSNGFVRHPWAFGAKAERIVSSYVRLRYRLLPTLCAAARRAFEDGTPLLRRCDLEWPQYAEARDPTQYLLGDDLLVAPMIGTPAADGETLPAKLLSTESGLRGLTAEYYRGTELSGEPAGVRREVVVDHNLYRDWAPPGVDPNTFSVRWVGRIGPVPTTALYEIGAEVDDGVRVWLDDKLIVDAWRYQAPTTCVGEAKLRKGRSYRLKVEYFQGGGGASCRLLWRLKKLGEATTRGIWVPPGRWQDLWSGRRLTGPRTLSLNAPLEMTPLLAREGGMVLTVPVRPNTAQPWRAVAVDIVVGSSQTRTERMLYEDDGESTAYQADGHARTLLILEQAANRVALTVGPREGMFDDAIRKRTWKIRFHFLRQDGGGVILLNGRILPTSGGGKPDLKRGTARWLRKTGGPLQGMPLEWDDQAAPGRISILEVCVPAHPVSAALQIDIERGRATTIRRTAFIPGEQREPWKH